MCSSDLAAQKAITLPQHDLSLSKLELDTFKDKLFLGQSIDTARWLSIKQEIRTIMWGHAGIVRDKQRLQTGLVKLLKFKDILRARPFIYEYKEIQNMLLLSLLITNFSIARKESRGSHFRTDFPQKDGTLNAKHYTQTKHQIKPVLT